MLGSDFESSGVYAWVYVCACVRASACVDLMDGGVCAQVCRTLCHIKVLCVHPECCGINVLLQCYSIVMYSVRH